MVNFREEGQQLRLDGGEFEFTIQLDVELLATFVAEERLANKPPPKVLLVLQLHPIIGATLKAKAKPGEPCRHRLPPTSRQLVVKPGPRVASLHDLWNAGHRLQLSHEPSDAGSEVGRDSRLGLDSLDALRRLDCLDRRAGPNGAQLFERYQVGTIACCTGQLLNHPRR